MEKIHRKRIDSFIFRWIIFTCCVFLIVFFTLVHLLLYPHNANSQGFSPSIISPYTSPYFQSEYYSSLNFVNFGIYKSISLPYSYFKDTYPYFLNGYYYRPPFNYFPYPSPPAISGYYSSSPPGLYWCIWIDGYW